ncbi:DHA2 family efflux MFS transporter permease subunit [Aurantimonas sp. MSK8Z-1]|uniref:DHA2 family efflux MFS transporter permease subunit n=1 Tax=Mangrovibrevibacter kandeliae TaxID=2968473 RepID=UPI00223127F3|nr:DHA2 family efflux MFS transporter permease subunit [Aurantimonas sp. MSK8Z-1]MCW4113643.1 DHA2 family efflux MFS transporter permease subunit [Aurantimonas sp. MSK8Z-1]
MTVSPSPAAEPHPRRWLVLATLLLAGFMNLIDVTIVNVAIPSLKADLGASDADVEWVVAAYILAFALGLLPLGRLGDIVGRKRMFLWGVGAFTLGSALCGLAPSIGTLVAARFFQGLSGAMMMPQVLALVQVTFPPHERGFAFSFFGVTAGLASVAGPLAGGALISADIYALAWRPIFLVNIPIGIFAVAVGSLLIPPTERARGTAIDLVGVLLATLAVFAVVFPLVEGRELGWPLWSFVMLGAALPLAALFILWQRRQAERDAPQLLPISLIRNRHFVLGLGMVTALFSGLPGFFFVIAIFLQIGFGFTPLQSGVATIPFPAGVFIASLISGRFGSRHAKQRLVVGPLILASGMAIFYATVLGLDDTLTHWDLVLPLGVSGLGMGVTIAPLFATILTVVGPRDAGSGAGALQAFQQAGGALGVALGGQIFFGMLGDADTRDAYRASLQMSLIYEMAVFLLLALLASRLRIGTPAGAAGADPASVPAEA